MRKSIMCLGEKKSNISVMPFLAKICYLKKERKSPFYNIFEGTRGAWGHVGLYSNPFSNMIRLESNQKPNERFNQLSCLNLSF